MQNSKVNSQNPSAKGQQPTATGCFAQRIFRPARVAEVELVNGVPHRVMCSGEPGPRGEVAWAAGPWRSSGEWWNAGSDPQAAWQREEWDVEIAGALYRLVKSEREGWAVDRSYDLIEKLSN